jgi:uncharacterized protein (DUF488 family)
VTRDLFSLGHSTHPLDRLADLCRGAGVDVVCDIRRFPRSRRNPHLSRERLEEELPARGIDYVWLGEDLGGFREPDYEAWMTTADFDRGLTELERLAEERTVGFMCSEGVPWKCHRLFVARALASRGHAVSHLLPDGTIQPEQPRLMPPGP